MDMTESFPVLTLGLVKEDLEDGYGPENDCDFFHFLFNYIGYLYIGTCLVMFTFLPLLDLEICSILG